jgi:hypothetical protein
VRSRAGAGAAARTCRRIHIRSGWWHRRVATLSPMLAAQIWHWWIGLIMLLAGGLATVGLIAGYLKTVSSQRYPGGKRGRQQEL